MPHYIALKKVCEKLKLHVHAAVDLNNLAGNVA